MATQDEMAGGMLRGSSADSRQQRQEVDTGTGEKRIPGNRAAHMSRGNFVNFYDDLGISATPDSAKRIRADEATFKQKVGEEKGRLNEARGKYNDSLSKIQAAESELAGVESGIPGFNEAYSKAFNEYRSQNLVKTTVVSGSNNTPEGTYYVPAGTLQSYAQSGMYYINEANGQAYISTKVKGFGERGAEIHQSLGTAQMQIENEFSKQAAPLIAQQLGAAQSSFDSQMSGQLSQLNDARAQVGQYGAQVSAAEAQLRATEQRRAAEWADIHAKYEKRKNTMNEIFGGFNVKEGRNPKANG